jgi:flagellar hook-associated protein 2
MATTSVSGTSGTIQFNNISGLDTASIISAVMASEAIPQNRLKASVAAEQNQVTALQTLNSAIAALLTSTDGFTTGSTWTQMTATSSNTGVTVSASGGATAANFAVTVVNTAKAAEVDFTSTAASTGTVVVPPSSDPSKNVLDITMPDGSTQQISTGDGKLSTIVTNLNALKGTDGKPLLNANAVAVGNGKYSLMVTSANTGAGSLTITDPQGNSFFDAANTLSTAGRDAQITVGNGLTLTSSSNTFTNVTNGVNVTLGASVAVGATSQISVADNGASRANAIKAFVSQINDVLTSINKATSYGTISTESGGTSVGAGALPGDPTLRDIATQLVNTIFAPGNKISLGNMGLSVDRDGALTFDATAFQTAYQADPQGVTAAFTGSDGFIKRVAAVATNTSSASSGVISGMITSMNDEIKMKNDNIAVWDDRLAMKQASLETMYTALQTTLTQMQSQSSWLSSALSSLDSGWTQNK